MVLMCSVQGVSHKGRTVRTCGCQLRPCWCCVASVAAEKGCNLHRWKIHTSIDCDIECFSCVVCAHAGLRHMQQGGHAAAEQVVQLEGP
jgi:hypothetical protein